MQLQLQSLAQQPAALPEPVATKLRRAWRSGERLARLIDTLLDVSRISSGTLELRPEPCSLCDVVREVVDRTAEEAERAGCAVTLELPASPIEGAWDRLRLDQVLTNLLSNAFKYGAERPVRVALEAGGDEVELRVEDEGPGVAPADVDRIFGRFERGVSLRHYGGLGLGLYVARRIVEAHGGSIACERRPDGRDGARFVVRLPRQQ